MEGRRGMNRGMQTMLLMLAMVASMAVVLLWEVSPFAPNVVYHSVVLESPIQSFASAGPTSDPEGLTKSYEPSQQRIPSLESPQGDLEDTGGNANKTTISGEPLRDSSFTEVGTDLIEERESTPGSPSVTNLSQQQNMTGFIVEEKELTTVAQENSTTDIPSTNGTQSTNELEATAEPLKSQQRPNDVAEPPETTSEAKKATVTENAMSTNTTILNSNSTLQLEEPTGTESNTVEEVAGQESDSEKPSSVNQNITDATNPPQRRRKSSGNTQLSDETQLLENVGESISSAVEDGKQAEVADAGGPGDNILENLGAHAEDEEARFKTDVEKGAHEKEAEVKVCDYTVGTWVLDKTRPLYSGRECPLWLSPDWACRLYDHPDKQMDRYRWQPAGCNMPVFNASAALETLRDKVVAFVGDSLGRQQYQSLLCMLTHGKNSTPISNAASTFGFYTPRGTRRPTGWAYRFDATNTTLLFKWSVTLARVQAMNKSTNALHLDRPEQFLSDHLPKLDIVILNSGHHWNNDKMQQNGYAFYTKGQPLTGGDTTTTTTSVPAAYNQTIHNVVHWIHEKTRNSSKVVYYRSLSPRHFRNGDWNTGGTCDTIRFEEGGKKKAQQVETVVTTDANAESAVKGTSVRLLNITALSMERGEAHVSKYGKYKGGQDCLHWCLPGVPDTWNEILLAELAGERR